MDGAIRRAGIHGRERVGFPETRGHRPRGGQLERERELKLCRRGIVR